MFEDIPYLIGQLLGLVAVVMGFLSFQRKTPVGIIACQFTAALVFAVHYTLIAAPTAIALNLLAAANCIYCYFRDKQGVKNMIGSYVLMALVILISLLTWEGWYSLAIMVGLVFNTISLALDHPQKTRGMMLVKAPLCFVYNLMVGSLGGMVYECAILSSAVIGLFRYRGKRIEKNQGGRE